MLGMAYAGGVGIDKDEIQAAKWYRLAAEQGNIMGQTRLGVAYATGFGVKPDYAEAVKWTRLAAEQADPAAQFDFGIAMSSGRVSGRTTPKR
jgi:TPR repeat protein